MRICNVLLNFFVSVYVYMSVNPIPLRIKRLNVYNLWNQLQWHEHSAKNSLPLSSINPTHLNSRTNMCVSKIMKKNSLNHFVNLSLGLNCTWLNYRIHVAPTAYRTFFVTTIFEITNFFWIGNFPFFRKYVLNVLQFHSSCQ